MKINSTFEGYALILDALEELELSVEACRKKSTLLLECVKYQRRRV